MAKITISRLLLVCFLATTAHAATFTVSDSSDSGPGTLRQAILDANAAAGADQIVFTVATINATDSLPQITGPVSIDGWVGSAPVTIHGVPFDCSYGFFFAPGSTGSTLRRVTVADYCESVRIAPGAANVTVANNTLRNRVVIAGDDNLIGGTTDGSNNLIHFLTITGDRNQVYRNTVVFGPVRVMFADQNRIGSAGNGNTLSPLWIESSAGTIIEGNMIVGTFETAIDIWNAIPPATGMGASILGNTILGKVLVREFTGVTISRNSITQADFAIDLGHDGITPNDAAPDADTGANNRQNYPVLTSAVLAGSQLVVTGTLTSAPLTTYAVELFGTPTSVRFAGPYLATIDVTTDAAGTATFSHTITSPLFGQGLPGAGDSVTSTATNRTTGDTSEVSAAVMIAAQAAEPIPTLSTWSLIAFALALATVMYLRSR